MYICIYYIFNTNKNINNNTINSNNNNNINNYEPPAGMPSSHCWCRYAHTRACAQGLRELALPPPLRGRPQFPGPAGPRPGGTLKL